MSNWTVKEKSQGELTVVVEGEAWKKAQKKALTYLKSRVNLKGFRAGQVPESLILKQISKEALYTTAAEEIANHYLQEAIEEHDLKLIDRPTLSTRDESDDSCTLVFTCTVEPEVTLGDYKGLDIKKEEVEVTEEEIANELKNVQERFADMVVREGEAVDGDTVNLDYVGKVDGVAFDGGSAEKYDLTLGSGTFIPGFEEQLVGVKAGDVRDVTVTFPEEYHAADLAGKEAIFTCTIHEVKYKSLPELNDELIKDMKIEGVETVDQYKEKRTNELKAQKEARAEAAFEDALVERVCENATVEVPEVMIAREQDNLYRDFENRMMQSGFTAKQFLEATGQTEAQVKATMYDDAKKRVTAALVLEAIVKAENIEVADEKLEEQYNEMATMYNMEADRIKQIISADALRYDLAQREALELIKSNVA